MQLATVPPKETALQVYSAENGLEPYLQIIKAEIDAFVPDVSTRKGREAIASIAYKVARSKTALDNAGKELVAELKEVPKKIDAERKRMRDLLDVWQDEVRRPLTEWEQREKDRVERIQAQVSRLGDTDVTNMPASEIRQSIDNLEAHVIDARYEEFEAEAHRVKAASLATLRDALAKREQYEAEQAELERHRAEAAAREQKEREERIAREAAEAERLAAERRAQEERDAATRREAEAKAAAERRELELKLQAEQAERAAAQAEASRIAAEQRAEQERIAAEERAAQAAEAARQAEIKRQADEQARIKAESDAREADRADKGAVLKAAKEAVMTVGITEDQAREVIKLIAAGGVPRIYISY
jgi:DNA repair exonuclease SbcCD ATPase subunit